MANGVEGCSEVKEKKDSEVTRVCGGEEVVGDSKQGCFSAVMYSNTSQKPTSQSGSIVLRCGLLYTSR